MLRDWRAPHWEASRLSKFFITPVSNSVFVTFVVETTKYYYWISHKPFTHLLRMHAFPTIESFSSRVCVRFRSTVRKRSRHGSSRKAFTTPGLGGWSWPSLAWPQVTHTNTHRAAAVLKALTRCPVLLLPVRSDVAFCSKKLISSLSLL